jgi:hypothetical protein
MIRVILCVLLKYTLFCGNSPRVCFVDFVVVCLVSCKKMIVGGVCVFITKSRMQGMAMFSVDAFLVLRYIYWLAIGIFCYGIAWVFSIGEGCMYSIRRSLHLTALVRHCSGRYENTFQASSPL